MRPPLLSRQLQVAPGLAGQAGVPVTADSSTWLGFANGERHLLWALLRGQIRIHGDLRLLRAFGRCFS